MLRFEGPGCACRTEPLVNALVARSGCLGKGCPSGRNELAGRGDDPRQGVITSQSLFGICSFIRGDCPVLRLLIGLAPGVWSGCGDV